jgi:hypothetical protein
MNHPPYLREVFEKLKNGYHISPEDDVLYAALNGERFDDYADYFAGLGVTLRKHEHDFFYFEPEPEDNNSPRLAKIAAFSFILIDHIANRGLPVEPTLFADSFTLRGLPHFTLDSYRARMEQVGILDHADLREVVNHLKNVGCGGLPSAARRRALLSGFIPLCAPFQPALHFPGSPTRRPKPMS